MTRPGKEAAFRKFFLETAIPLMRGTDGLVSALLRDARADGPREFSSVMLCGIWTR